VLGFVISTPFVLQIFKPEIANETQQMQAAQREAYYKGLPTNPVYVAQQSDQTLVNQLKAKEASGGTLVVVSNDPQIKAWTQEEASANAQVQYWTAEQNCQLYGGTNNGVTCQRGYGPVAKNDQNRIDYWSGLANTYSNDIKSRTGLLEAQDKADQSAAENSAKAELPVAEHALQAATAQLNAQTKNINSSINGNDGILEQLKALSAVTAGNFTLQLARLMLFLLFLFVDIMPVFIKLLFNLAPASNYDRILANEEEMQLRMAEDDRAVWQAAHRQATQAEAAGVRRRNDAISAPLEGMRQAILDSRMRVEKEWLKRREADQMRDAIYGQGISGIRSQPRVDGRHSARPQQQTGGFRAKSPWNGGTSAAGQPGPRSSTMPPGGPAGPATGPWPSPPPLQPDLPRRPGGPSTWVESLRAWLGSLRLPRLPRLGQHRRPQEQAPGQRPASQPVPQPQPAGWSRTGPGGPFGQPGPDQGGGPTRPESQFQFGSPPADQGGGRTRPESQFQFGSRPADQAGGPTRPGPQSQFGSPPADQGGGAARPGPPAGYIPAPTGPDNWSTDFPPTVPTEPDSGTSAQTLPGPGAAPASDSPDGYETGREGP
jgi:Domain of unknown function (DUF4407)